MLKMTGAVEKVSYDVLHGFWVGMRCFWRNRYDITLWLFRRWWLKNDREDGRQYVWEGTRRYGRYVGSTLPLSYPCTMGGVMSLVGGGTRIRSTHCSSQLSDTQWGSGDRTLPTPNINVAGCSGFSSNHLLPLYALLSLNCNSAYTHCVEGSALRLWAVFGCGAGLVGDIIILSSSSLLQRMCGAWF